MEEAFEHAAAAMFGVMVDRDAASPTTSVDVVFEEDDLELALVRWLNGLLAEARIEKLALTTFDIERHGSRNPCPSRILTGTPAGSHPS